MPPWEGTARDLRGLSSTAGHAVTLRGVASAEEWYVRARHTGRYPVVTPETTCTRESVAPNVSGTRAAKSDYTAHTRTEFRWGQRAVALALVIGR